jgi:hypothetical protein
MFRSGSSVPDNGVSVLDFDGYTGVESDERVLGQLLRAFDGFKKVHVVVVFVELRE